VFHVIVFYVLYIQIGFISFVVLYCTQKQELAFQVGKVMPVDQATPADLAHFNIKP